MPKANRSPLVAKRRIGDDTFVIEIRDPEIAAVAKPGQFVMIRGSEAVDPLTPRPFSIVARIREGGEPVGFALLVKVLGRGSRAIVARKEGDLLPVTGPLGTPLELDASLHYLMAAGGTGIAPVVFAAQELERADGGYTILYGGKTKGDVHLKELSRYGIEALPATEDGSLGHAGLVTGLLERELELRADNLTCFACGPWEMMRKCSEICAARGVGCHCSLERYMACGFGVCLACVYRSAGGGYRTCCQDGPVVNSLEVDWDA